MPSLPPRPDLDQLRTLAKELVRAAKAGEARAIERHRAVSAPMRLAGAQLAIAREYGFPSWARLKRDVERREVLDARDVVRLRGMLKDEPDLSWTTMEHWIDHPKGASPLGYVAMLRYDTAHGTWRDVDVIDRLIAAGVPVDATDPAFGGHPLRTAATDGRPASVRRLLDHGADPELRDPATGLTPLGLCRRSRASGNDTPGHAEVEAILAPLTGGG